MERKHAILDYSPLGPEFSDNPGKRKIDNISGIAWDGAHLWTAADEHHTIERLSPQGVDGFIADRSYAIEELFKHWPAGKEADIEGLAFDSGRLWLCGSHCKVRKGEHVHRDDLREPSRFKNTASRTLLGCVELDAQGNPDPSTAAALGFAEEEGSLLSVVNAELPALAPHFGLPAKENGLDIEGICAVGDRILLGLRGPVIAGYAIVLSFRVSWRGQRLDFLLEGERRLHSCLLDLNGAGIRDLARTGEDVLILAGPSMDLDGPFCLYGWRGAAVGAGVADGTQLQFIADLPFERGEARGSFPGRCERPEGLTVIASGDLLLIHDAPLAWRVRNASAITADVYMKPI
jgi:hypothetical protein